MTSRLSTLTAVFVLFIASIGFAGCNAEPGERTQFVGQECFSDGNCAAGLACIQRRCVREGASDQMTDAGAADAAEVGPADSGDPDGDGQADVRPDALPEADARPIDAGPAEDAPVVCHPPGRRGCYSDTRVRICREDGRGYEYEPCADGLRCQDGECVEVDTSTCQFQNQPCDQEGFSNGYYCTAFDGAGDQLRCLGSCDADAVAPDATCPDPGSVCAVGDDDGAICVSSCTVDEGCDVPGYGCLPSDNQQGEGICVPTSPQNEIGDRCDDENPFDCEEGAVCADIEGLADGARCVEACRSFSDDSASDCSDGHCFPVTDLTGICRPDAANLSEGDQCDQHQLYQTCGEDAVLCAPSGSWQPPQCTRLCRLSQGDADCSGGQTCTQFDQQRDDLGVCVGP